MDRTPQIPPASKGPISGIYAGVCLVFLIIAAVLISTTCFRARELRRRSICAANLKAYANALASIPGDSEKIAELKPAACPNTRTSNYALNLRPGVRLAPDAIVAYEPLENHGEGGNILYADGHIDFMFREGYEKYLKPLQPATASSPH